VRIIAIIAACAAWMCVDCNAHAGEILAKCRSIAEPIVIIAVEEHVPVLLLTALLFSESSCDPNKINSISGAVGAGQVLPSGAGAGYTTKQLRDPWLNIILSAQHLSKWHRRCHSWLGAVTVYHGNERCSAKSSYAKGIIRMWKKLEHESEPRT
jgi:soluble lytic murein transglycosylase-like protein